jgi:hypothetical protein
MAVTKSSPRRAVWAGVGMASIAEQPSSSIGVAFLKSCASTCLEGCVIFSVKISDRMIRELLGLG